LPKCLEKTIQTKDVTFDKLKLEIPTSLKGWNCHLSSNVIQLSLLIFSPPAPPTSKFTVTITNDLKLKATIYSNIIPATSAVVQKVPSYIQCVHDVETICDKLQNASSCQGNMKPDLVSMAEERGGEISNCAGGVSARIDCTTNNEKTVRHQKCEILCEPGKNQCTVCRRYSGTLRAMKSRKVLQQENSRTMECSHTNYRYLQNLELKERLHNVQKTKRSLKRQVCRLQEKIKNLITTQGLRLTDDDQNEIEDLLLSTNTEVVKKYSKDDFQRIFWEQQMSYNQHKNKKGMRWHPLIIRFALNLRYLSSAAYKAVGSFLALPSKRTLQDYTHIIKFQAGTSSEIINRLKKDMDFEHSSPSQRKVGLLTDEMTIKSGLVFNKSTGKLVGFTELSEVNEKLRSLSSDIQETEAQERQLADHMLVVMVRSIFKPSHIPCGSTSYMVTDW